MSIFDGIEKACKTDGPPATRRQIEYLDELHHRIDPYMRPPDFEVLSVKQASELIDRYREELGEEPERHPADKKRNVQWK